jgi:hypothetical protein
VREYCFDEAPAQRKIGIAFGQGPNDMQVVGQNDDCLEIEGMAASDIAECPAQRVDVRREQTPPAIGQIHREEKAAGEEITPVVGHWRSITKAPRMVGSPYDGYRFALSVLQSPMMGIASLHPSYALWSESHQ